MYHLDEQFGIENADKLRRKFNLKKRRSTSEDSALFEKLSRKAENSGVKTRDYSPVGPAYDNRTDTVVGLGSKKGADILSHELGHRHFFKDKDAGTVGKTAHKLYDKMGGSLRSASYAPITASIAGKITGKRKARKEEEGEKESAINKHAAWVAPIVTTSPMLVSEIAASRHGIKSLKESGASKNYIKNSRKNLGKAFGTYATKTLMGVGMGVASKEAAYRREKKKLRKNREKKKENRDWSWNQTLFLALKNFSPCFSFKEVQ